MVNNEIDTNNPINPSAHPEGMETATFALGCFWSPDALFGSLPGVIRTRVGYAGGTTQNPTYRNIGDHSETIQIDYDSNLISYEQLLTVFWESHNPVAKPYSRQYSSIIFTHNQEQEQIARDTSQEISKKLGQSVLTEIVSFRNFTRAEDYHQKYMLRQRPAFSTVLSALFPETDKYVDSTLAARLNAFVARHINLKELAENLAIMELADETRRSLLEIASRLERR